MPLNRFRGDSAAILQSALRFQIARFETAAIAILRFGRLRFGCEMVRAVGGVLGSGCLHAAPPPPVTALARLFVGPMSVPLGIVSCDRIWYVCVCCFSCVWLGVPVFVLVREERGKSQTHTFWGPSFSILIEC